MIIGKNPDLIMMIGKIYLLTVERRSQFTILNNSVGAQGLGPNLIYTWAQI